MGADPRRARVLQRRGRRADRRDVLGEPRPPRRGGGSDARRVPAAAALARSRFPCSRPPWRPRRRSSSSSRSPRSASSSSSAARGTRRSRPRSTTRRSACSTCAPPPCSRSYSSCAWSPRCGSRPARAPARGHRSAARRARHAPAGAQPRGEKVVVGAQSRRARALPRTAARGSRRAVTRCRKRPRSRGLPRRSTDQTSVLLAAPWEAIVNSIVYATAAAAIAIVIGGLAAFAVAGSRGSRAPGRARCCSPSAPRRSCSGSASSSPSTRAPLDFRAAPWIVPVAQALVADPLRRPDHGSRRCAPSIRGQRDAAALLGASPGRVRREVDLPIVARGARGRRRLRVRDLARRVRCHGLPCAPRPPHAAGRDLPLPRAPGRAEPRDQAYALAVVLMAVTVVSVLLVERIRLRRGGWF